MVAMSDKRRAAYGKLAALVDEFAQLDRDEEGDERSMPTAWALVVGFEGHPIDDDDSPGGSTVVYPKDQDQASWKTGGIIAAANSHYNS